MKKAAILSALALLAIGVTSTAQATFTGSGNEIEITFQGKTAEAWHVRYIREHKTLAQSGATVRSLQSERRKLTHQLTIRGESEPIMAIRFVFGRYADQAIRVSSCETGGTFDTRATNGQYLGLFQMGDYARGRYGHGPTAIEQAKAAYAYFTNSGRDWSPWECKP